MPSWIEEPEAAACKWVSIREDNARYELPAVFSILVYTHPETGFPLAICDGSYHTLMRTGASAAVSAKWLARPGSTVLAILGTGSVGGDARDLRHRLYLERGRSGAARRSRSTASWPSRPRLPAPPARRHDRHPHGGRRGRRHRHRHARPRLDRRRAVGEGGRASRGTRRRPRGRAGAPRPAPGARSSTTFRQRPRRRDQRPLREGLITEDDIAGEIGKVICELEGRQSDDQITVFDSTGIALQDSRRCRSRSSGRSGGVGIEKKMIST